MRPFTSTDVLRIWELGEPHDSLNQALIILAAAFPEYTIEQLADLSLGQRDRLLFILRRSLFGSELCGFVACPQCGERLEFTLRVPEICDAEPVAAASEERAFSAAGFDLRFRLPNSRDLIAAAAASDSQRARQLLVAQCLWDVRRDGTSIVVTDLPEAVVTQVVEQIAQCDPLQEVLVDLDCPSCGHRWHSIFDIVTFFWSELAALAKRLLREVHTLARAYGWRQHDILAMSARRRRSYLELVGG